MPKQVFSQSFTKIEWVCVALLGLKCRPKFDEGIFDTYVHLNLVVLGQLLIFILKFPDLYAKIECWPYYPGVVQAPVQMTLFQINSSKYCIQNNWGWKLQNLKKELIFVFTNIRKFWLYKCLFRPRRSPQLVHWQQPLAMSPL